MLSKILSIDNLVLFPSQCLKARHQEVECNICINACPYKAIKFREKILVDETKCQGCGICTHLCPAGVFELKNWTEIIKKIRLAIKDEQIKIGCPKVGNNVDAEVSCLGLISEGFLLYLFEQKAKTIELDDSACENCLANWGKSLAKIKISTTVSILKKWGQDIEISFCSGNKQDVISEKRYSRRDFFSHFRDSTLKRVFSIMETPNNKEIEHRLPNARLLMLSALRRLNKPIESKVSQNGLPFYQIEISKECLSCELCSRLCPTGSLSKLSTDESEKIMFNMGYCTGCGLCEKVCSQKALNFAKEINISLLLDKEQEIISYAYLRCPDCERKYLEIEAECAFCKKENCANVFFDEIFAGVIDKP